MATNGGNEETAAPRPREVLDYATKQVDAPISLMQVVEGVFLSFIIVVGVVLLAGGAASEAPALLIPIGGAPIFGIVYWAIWAHRSRVYRGLAIGLWIGLGLAISMFILLAIALRHLNF